MKVPAFTQLTGMRITSSISLFSNSLHRLGQLQDFWSSGGVWWSNSFCKHQWLASSLQIPSKNHQPQVWLEPWTFFITGQTQPSHPLSVPWQGSFFALGLLVGVFCLKGLKQKARYSNLNSTFPAWENLGRKRAVWIRIACFLPRLKERGLESEITYPQSKKHPCPVLLMLPKKSTAFCTGYLLCLQ
jgi:hypothetical protein